MLNVRFSGQTQLDRRLAKTKVLIVLQLQHPLHVLKLELARILQQLANCGVRGFKGCTGNNVSAVGVAGGWIHIMDSGRFRILFRTG